MDFEASLRLRVSFTTTYNFLDLAAKPRDENPDASQDCVRYHALEQSGRCMAYELQHKIENQEKDMTDQVKGEKTEENSYQDHNMKSTLFRLIRGSRGPGPPQHMAFCGSYGVPNSVARLLHARRD